NTEAGDHLVKNQKRIVAGAFLAEDRQKVFSRKIKTRVGWNRLDDHRRDFIFVFLKRFSQQLGVVERQRDRELSKRRCNTGAARLAVRERAAPYFYQERIRMPMITAVELDDLITPGECAREPDA